MGDGTNFQPVDVLEAFGVARIEGKAVRDRDRRDQCVERPRGRLAASASKRCGDLTEGACRLRVERQGLEVSFRLLELSEAAGLLRWIVCHEWADR